MSSQKLGLRSARNPASIANEQNHEASQSQRSSNGMPGTIAQVVADSTVKTPVKDNAPLWVVNRDATPHFLFIGDDTQVPNSVGAANGLCIPAGQGLLIWCPASSSDKVSVALKSDNSLVHVTILQQ